MPFHVEPHGKKHVDLVFHNQTIENVRKYNPAGGKIAVKMGFAKKILADDGKAYYVNLRDIGRAWNKVQPNPKLSQSDTAKSKVDGVTSKINHYFHERAKNKESGLKFILNELEARKKLDGNVRDMRAAIVNLHSEKIDENKRSILGIIGEPSDWSSNNVEEKFQQLEEKLRSIDAHKTLKATLFEAIFSKEASDKDVSKGASNKSVSEYQMREVLDSFYKLFSEL